MKFKWLVSVAALAISSNVFAGGWYTTDGVVEQINVESGLVSIRLSAADIKYHDGCDETNEVVIQDDTKNGDRQVSILLAAHMSGKKVNIYTSGCVFNWGKKYPKVFAVRVKN